MVFRILYALYKEQNAMANPFKLCILFGDAPDRPPDRIAPGWEMAEVPVGLLLDPFESNAHYTDRCAEIASWHVPPIKVSSHFLHHYGLAATGPGVDWEQLEFWTKRAFERLEPLGVKTVGVYGGFFRLSGDFPRTQATDQALRFASMLADHAGPRGITIALEPMGELDTLWPRYLDGLAFVRQLARPEVRLMADMNYFFKLPQPLEDITKAPELCMHCHIAGDHGQPGVGDMGATYLRLFRILRDIGYEGGVSAACPWVSTGTGAMDFGVETAKTLRYLQELRDRVYSE
jgi:sugar phosphate isomerase/epimerase